MVLMMLCQRKPAIGVNRRNIEMAFPYEALKNRATRSGRELRNDEPHRLKTRKYCLCINLLEHFIFLASFIERFQTFNYFVLLSNESTQAHRGQEVSATYLNT